MVALRNGSVIALLVLSGCAQTVWVKPGASAQEYSVAHLQCDVFASNATTRQPVYGSRPGTILASALVAGIAEGVENASWKSRCMQALGFASVPVRPAGAAAAVAPQGVAAVEPQPVVPEQMMKGPGEPMAKQAVPIVVHDTVAAQAPMRATVPPMVQTARCTAFTYAEYLQQKRVCDADVGGGS